MLILFLFLYAFVKVSCIHVFFAVMTSSCTQPRTIIIEYLGQVITSVEGKRRMSSMTDDDDFYFMSLGDGLMLDAKPMGR